MQLYQLYIIYNGGILSDSDKQNIKKYLIVSMLGGVFGTHGDRVLTTLQKAFRDKNDYSHFDFDWIKTLTIDNELPYILSDERIEGLFKGNQKNAITYIVLMMLNPNLKLNQIKFDQDHIHPYAGFSRAEFTTLNLIDEQIKKWKADRNKLPNLELLKDTENRSKKDKPFKEWLDDNIKNPAEQQVFKQTHLIPDVDLSLANFENFYEERKKLMINQLKTMI